MRASRKALLFRQFTPRSIPGLQLWLDASRLGLADGDPVGAWSDLSGNARNFSQATTAKKPTFKTNILNGLPVVRFDGVDDFLAAGDVLGFARTDLFSIFYVAKQSNGSESGVITKMDRGADYPGYAFGSSAGLGNREASIVCSTITGNRYFQTSYASDTPGSFKVYGWTYSGTGSAAGIVHYANGGSALAATVHQDNLGANSIANTAQLALGARVNSDASNLGVYAAMDLFEVVVYAGVPSEAQRNRLTRYLGRRPGIAVS